jgi:signal transduction histidine kinase
MAEDYREGLIAMMTAPTLDATIALGLETLFRLVDTTAAALLLWDVDLDRYIIGDISTQSPEERPSFRRLVLRAGSAAFQQNRRDPRCLEEKLYYEPLNTPDGRHVGAYLYSISTVTHDPLYTQQRGYSQLVRATTRALWVMTRIEQADHEHAQLNAERERLQQLLYAVDQQQQTIDRLLTLERQFSASLETQVEERTAALRDAQARIIHSEKLAVIGQLAGSLAHEINNPLQAIQSGLGLAIAELSSGDIESVRNDLLVIQTELERIQAIFRQMLDFNRPAQSVREPLDLNAICEGVQVLLRKRLQENHIELHLELEPSLPLTCGDSNQIKQVLINLILNAAEAMSPAGGRIIARTNTTSQAVHLCVEDSGCGISLEHLQHLFEPFFTTKTRGLGLGLAISREIIEQHQGDIIVQSAVGQRTQFIVILPTEKHCHGEQSTSAGGG